jgi:hypothetical protein
LEQVFDKFEVLYAWAGCMLREEGARIAEERESVEAGERMRYRICEMGWDARSCTTNL